MNFSFDLGPEFESPVILKSERLSVTEQRLHFEAMARAARYLESEASLLETIMDVDRTRLYLKFDLNSTFTYCVKLLNLSEAVAYNFIAVARKAREVPELKDAIKAGELGVSKARKIVSILTPENQDEWIRKARELPQAKLEREVAECAPEAAAKDKERMRPVKNSRVRVEAEVSQDVSDLIRRVQDLVSGGQKKPASLEDALKAMAEFYLDRKDPVERAKRAGKRRLERAGNCSCDEFVAGESNCSCDELPATAPDTSKLSHDELGTKSENHIGFRRPKNANRDAIAAAVEHAVHLRYGGKCWAKRADGSFCHSTKFIQLHHILPVSAGGGNDIRNLISLCGRCHRLWHRQSGGLVVRSLL
jgi:hypothetical protein